MYSMTIEPINKILNSTFHPAEKKRQLEELFKPMAEAKQAAEKAINHTKITQFAKQQIEDLRNKEAVHRDKLSHLRVSDKTATIISILKVVCSLLTLFLRYY